MGLTKEPAAGGFSRGAVRQAAVMMLLAALPAVGAWGWQQAHGGAVSAAKADGAAATEGAASVDATGMVDLAQATAWGASVLWVDARGKSDFERAHVPSALLLNEDDWSGLLPVLLERWTPDRRVVVYCDGGACQASRQVSARLRDAGVSPVYALRGGWPEWEQEQGKMKSR